MMKFKARAYRTKRKPGEMNSTERDYAAHLELLKKAGEILDYSFECETLKIGQDCRYTPDFRVVKDEGLHSGWVYPSLLEEPMKLTTIEFHEVKGTKRKKDSIDTKPYIEDDALVKIKAAAELHPYKFILVWKGLNGQWERKEIN